MARFRFALVHALSQESRTAVNKDLNGGFGTKDYYGSSWSAKALVVLKGRSVRLPVVSVAFLQGILRQQGHSVDCVEEVQPQRRLRGPYDVILLYGSLVDYRHENRLCGELKAVFPAARVGVFGPFPSIRPELFAAADFVITGEVEPFFLYDFREPAQLEGAVAAPRTADLDELPTPDYRGLPIRRYGYDPLVTARPFAPLLASRGCPHPCRYYCPYGQHQGRHVRQRSAARVAGDIVTLQRRHGIRGIQFRDALFGHTRGFVAELVRELRDRRVDVEWGMETRLELLHEEELAAMHRVGLRSVNLGIETTDGRTGAANQRAVPARDRLESVVRSCERLGIKVAAFYLLAMEDDTEERFWHTLEDALRLEPFMARFAVATPYPGTPFFDDLERAGRLLTEDYERYDQFTLVYRHPHFTPERTEHLLSEAYRRFYLRPRYVARFLGWSLRDLRSRLPGS